MSTDIPHGMDETEGLLEHNHNKPIVRQWRQLARGMVLAVVGVVVLSTLVAVNTPQKKQASAFRIDGIAEKAAEEREQISGVQYMQQGYNVFKGNPLPGDGEMDPGFTGFHIFHFSWHLDKGSLKMAPEKIDISEAMACEVAMSTQMFNSEVAYKKHIESIAGCGGEISGSHPVNATFGAAFKGNAEYSDAVKQITQENKKKVVSTAMCSVYEASIDEYDLPKMSSELKDALDSLPAEFGDGSEYYEFIENVGTHYLGRVTLGARYGKSATLTEEAHHRLHEKGHDVSAEASVSMSMAGMMGGSLGGSLEAHGSQSAASSDESAFSDALTDVQVVTIGGEPPHGSKSEWLETSRSLSMPIDYKIIPLTEFLEGKVEKAVIDNMLQAQQSYCENQLGFTKSECTGQLYEDQCLWDSDCEDSSASSESLKGELLCFDGSCKSGCKIEEDCNENQMCRKNQCESLCESLVLEFDHGGAILCEDDDAHCDWGDPLNRPRCQSYATRMNLDFDDEDASNHPSGCYMKSASGDKNQVWFNKDTTGASTATESQIRMGGRRGSLVQNAYSLGSKKTSTGAPTYWSLGGEEFIYYCGLDDRWMIANKGQWQDGLGSELCLGHAKLPVGEALMNSTFDESAPRTVDLRRSEGGEYDSFENLLIKCMACNDIEFRGFDNDDWNTLWISSDEDEGIFETDAGNNWMYQCRRDKSWHITTDRAHAKKGSEEDIECQGHAITTGTVLSPHWKSWVDHSYLPTGDKETAWHWVVGQCKD